MGRTRGCWSIMEDFAFSAMSDIGVCSSWNAFPRPAACGSVIIAIAVLRFSLRRPLDSGLFARVRTGGLPNTVADERLQVFRQKSAVPREIAANQLSVSATVLDGP